MLFMIILEEQLVSGFLDCKLKTTEYGRVSNTCGGKQMGISVY